MGGDDGFDIAALGIQAVHARRRPERLEPG